MQRMMMMIMLILVPLLKYLLSLSMSISYYDRKEAMERNIEWYCRLVTRDKECVEEYNGHAAGQV
jgi:hypothetical protein